MPTAPTTNAVIDAARGLTPGLYRVLTGASHPTEYTDPRMVECPACEREVYPCSDGSDDLFDDADEFHTHRHDWW